MAKRKLHERTEETMASDPPARMEEPLRVIEDYINDLREILRKLRKPLS